MPYNLKNKRGDIHNSMYFHYGSGVDEYVDVIVSTMSEKVEEMGIPAVIKQDTIREGRFVWSYISMCSNRTSKSTTEIFYRCVCY